MKFQRVHPDGRKETVDTTAEAECWDRRFLRHRKTGWEMSIDALMRVEESIIERLHATGWFKREDEEELRVLLNEERARERDRKEER